MLCTWVLCYNDVVRGILGKVRVYCRQKFNLFAGFLDAELVEFGEHIPI